MNLHRPIGIFDAGIGSYAVVERVRRHYPQQDILYFADRASFPYGAKTLPQLLGSVKQACDYLAGQGCVAIVLASNAPSVTVLDALQAEATVPVIGIFPPVRAALAQSRSKRIAILGVRSMIDSVAMHDYVEQQRAGQGTVMRVNASPLVDLVENFTFLHDPDQTRQAVSRFIDQLLRDAPDTDVMTLSSTHLPWLLPFFQQAAPRIRFLDPADSVLAQLSSHVSSGQGLTRCIASETADLPLAQFNAALQQLGVAFQAQAFMPAAG